eukprot:s699_g18.t1
MACEGDMGPRHCFIADTARPLTEESLQEALSRADDGIIRVEIQEGNQNNRGGDNQAVEDNHQNMSNDMPNAVDERLPNLPSGFVAEDVEAQALQPSAPPPEPLEPLEPLSGVWHGAVNAHVVQDPPPHQLPQPVQGQVLPDVPQVPQVPHVPQMPQSHPWVQQIPQLGHLEHLGQLGQLISQNLQQANQHVHQHLHQHLHRTHEHLQRHMQQLHTNLHNRQREMHEEMHRVHRRCAEMHQRAHCQAHANANSYRAQNPPRDERTHWANTMNVQTEVQPFIVHPLEMNQQRRHMIGGMITGSIRLYNSDLVLDNCMVTGALHLSGSSRVLLRGGMLTGSVMRDASSNFENHGGLLTGQVLEI